MTQEVAMQRTQTPSAPEVWVGIDAGKEFHWAHVLDASGTQLLSRRVENDEAELVALIEEVLSLAGRSQQITPGHATRRWALKP